MTYQLTVQLKNGGHIDPKQMGSVMRDLRKALEKYGPEISRDGNTIRVEGDVPQGSIDNLVERLASLRKNPKTITVAHIPDQHAGYGPRPDNDLIGRLYQELNEQKAAAQAAELRARSSQEEAARWKDKVIATQEKYGQAQQKVQKLTAERPPVDVQSVESPWDMTICYLQLQSKTIIPALEENILTIMDEQLDPDEWVDSIKKYQHPLEANPEYRNLAAKYARAQQALEAAKSLGDFDMLRVDTSEAERIIAETDHFRSEYENMRQRIARVRERLKPVTAKVAIYREHDAQTVLHPLSADQDEPSLVHMLQSFGSAIEATDGFSAEGMQGYETGCPDLVHRIRNFGPVLGVSFAPFEITEHPQGDTYSAEEVRKMLGVPNNRGLRGLQDALVSRDPRLYDAAAVDTYVLQRRKERGYIRVPRDDSNL